LTKQEKELVKKIEAVMSRKKVEGNPEDLYSIEKKSTNNYIGVVTIGNLTAEVKGKDLKTTVKNLTKEIK
jgi:hypothetical protein